MAKRAVVNVIYFFHFSYTLAHGLLRTLCPDCEWGLEKRPILVLIGRASFMRFKDPTRTASMVARAYSKSN